VGVTLAADGRLWYTCTGSAHVGSMAVNPGPQNPAVEYGAGGTPYGPIASGPAGRLWFTDIAGEIADFDIDTQTVINYELPAMDHAFVGVADGGDGRLWATDVAAYVEEVKPTDGGLTSVGQPLPTSTAYPYLIAWCQGWGGAWLAEGAGNALAFVPRSTSPIVEVPLPNASSAPYAVACDAQGSVWYTAPGINKIGRYRKDTLTFEEFTVPTANANVNGIAVAGDGSIWFTELNANKVGRLQIRPQGDANGDGTVDVADVFYVINFLFAGGPPPVP
jgi:virginiamycin B lyase